MKQNTAVNSGTIEILRRYALDVAKVFNLKDRKYAALESEIGCLLAVVFYAMRQAENQRGHLYVDEIFRWKKILLPLICEEMGEEVEEEQAEKGGGEHHVSPSLGNLCGTPQNVARAPMDRLGAKPRRCQTQIFHRECETAPRSQLGAA